MEKLEKRLFTLALIFMVTVFSSAGLTDINRFYEKKITSYITYGAAAGGIVSIFGASWAYDRNNRKKENSNRNYKRANK